MSFAAVFRAASDHANFDWRTLRSRNRGSRPVAVLCEVMASSWCPVASKAIALPARASGFSAALGEPPPNVLARRHTGQDQTGQTLSFHEPLRILDRVSAPPHSALSLIEAAGLVPRTCFLDPAIGVFREHLPELGEGDLRAGEIARFHQLFGFVQHRIWLVGGTLILL
jgi:hypothetical protein